jgi:hypothetical protein
LSEDLETRQLQVLDDSVGEHLPGIVSSRRYRSRRRATGKLIEEGELIADRARTDGG